MSSGALEPKMFLFSRFSAPPCISILPFSNLLRRFAVDVGGFVNSSDLSIFKTTTLVGLDKLLICVMQITHSVMKALTDLEKL
jgi:hypothetical protein